MSEQVNENHTEVTYQPLSLDELDNLLQILPPVKQASAEIKKETTELDALLQSLDHAIDATIQEIKEWDIDKKREAVKGAETDSFTLKVLADDPNPLIKTLALCNPNVPSSVLQRAGRVESPWFQMIAARNSSTPPPVLDDLSTSEHMDILIGVDTNPTTSPVTKFKLEEIIASDNDQSEEDDY